MPNLIELAIPGFVLLMTIDGIATPSCAGSV
jgi:hypothetical protein